MTCKYPNKTTFWYIKHITSKHWCSNLSIMCVCVFSFRKFTRAWKQTWDFQVPLPRVGDPFWYVGKEVVWPCHWGTLNGGYGFVGKAHPRHPFTMPHLIVYVTSRAAWKKLSDEWNYSRWKINVCKMKGLNVHLDEWKRLCEILIPHKFSHTTA